jgi:acid phosphatase
MEYLNKLLSKWMPESSKKVAVDSHPRLSGIMDTINSTLAHGPETRLPKEFYDEKGRKIIEKIGVEEWYSGYQESQEYRSLGIGSLMGDVVERMVGSVERNGNDGLFEIGGKDGSMGSGRGGEQSIKLGLSGCHDTTLAGVLASLGTFQGELWPPYTSRKFPLDRGSISHIETITNFLRLGYAMRVDGPESLFETSNPLPVLAKLIKYSWLDIAFELFKNSTNQSSQVLGKDTIEKAAQAVTTGDAAVGKGWYKRIFGDSNLAGMNGDKNAPVGIARQKVETLKESDRAKLDGYYVRIRYNDKVVTVPGCKAAGKHLDGDESFCTLASTTFRAFNKVTNNSSGSI